MSDRWFDIERDLYSIENIAAEIIGFSGKPPADIWRRLALELDQTGANVVAETERFGVTPFVFDEAMIRFYNESDGFIFESIVESRNAFRVSKWRQIVDFLKKDSLASFEKVSVLLYGDSVGSDSIYLKRLGFDVVYHDFDSYCAQFARYRFDKRALSIPRFSDDRSRRFDYLICLEVAEHVPNPPDLIRELRGYLKHSDGVCLFSEAFSLLKPQFPTHVQTNIQYAGKTDQLFNEHGMTLLWKDPDNKPIAYALNPTRGHFNPFPAHPPVPPRPLWWRVLSKIGRVLR